LTLLFRSFTFFLLITGIDLVKEFSLIHLPFPEHVEQLHLILSVIYSFKDCKGHRGARSSSGHREGAGVYCSSCSRREGNIVRSENRGGSGSGERSELRFRVYLPPSIRENGIALKIDRG